MSTRVSSYQAVTPAQNQQTLGRFIVEQRHELGKSQRELAQTLNISPQYLSDIEQNRRQPNSDELLQAIAKALSCNATYLFYLTNTLPPQVRGLDASPHEVVELFNIFQRSIA